MLRTSSLLRRQVLAGAMIVAFGTTATTHASAQSAYPSGVVRIISPFAPGGISDVYARLIAAKLADTWGHPVVVENRPGAGGNIAASFVAKSKPDGHTLIMGNLGTHAVNVSLFKTLPFDPIRDFSPIALVIEAEGLVVLNDQVPAKNLSELNQYARSGTAKLTIATGGVGTAGHLGAELYKTQISPGAVIIHYRGAAGAANDVIAGHANMMFATMSTVLPHVQAGTLRPIAVMGRKRSPAVPDVPTMQEAGMPGFVVDNWIGLFAPAGTSPDIVSKLNSDVVAVMQSADIQARLTPDGVAFAATTPDGFGAFVKSEIERWAPVIKASGASAE